MPEIISGVVFGQPQRKDNRRMIVRNKRTGKPMVIKSRESIKYVDSFIKQVRPESIVGWTCNVEVQLIMYYQSNRSDLSPELIFDCLQKAGVIKNDRQIVKCVMEKRIDKSNPHVVWAIKKVDG